MGRNGFPGAAREPGFCLRTANTPASVAFTGQLSPSNPVVFGDFGNGHLDFAGACAVANVCTKPNQIVVYLSNGTSYAGTALTTSDGVYDSCFLGGGQLGTATDLVSANCTDNTVTVYVNSGTGSFGQGAYYPSSSALLSLAQPAAVTIADINGDGKNDIVVTD